MKPFSSIDCDTPSGITETDTAQRGVKQARQHHSSFGTAPHSTVAILLTFVGGVDR